MMNYSWKYYSEVDNLKFLNNFFLRLKEKYKRFITILNNEKKQQITQMNN